MNIQRYISSGVLEGYITGLISPEEEAKLDKMRVLYPEVELQVQELERQLESYFSTHPMTPSPAVKKKFMDLVRADKDQPITTGENQHQEVASPDFNGPLPLAMKLVLIFCMIIIALSLLAIFRFYKK